MDKKRVERVKAAIVAAEEAVRKSIAEAASEAGYEEVRHLARLAESLRSIQNGSWSDPTLGGVNRRGGGTEAKPATKEQSRGGKRGYPRFEKNGKQLVKVGWSKKSKAEYAHKAEYEVVTVLIDKFDDPPREMTTEEMFPLTDRDGEVIPDYQAYLALAWLCDLGVVEKLGRQGYKRRSGNLSRDVGNAWNRLPERGGVQ